MVAIIKRVHAISPCARDISEPFEISMSDLATVGAARAWLKRHGVTGLGDDKRARRLECGGWVFFPPQTTLTTDGSVWWSIQIRLDAAAVTAEAVACTCRNCKYHERETPHG